MGEEPEDVDRFIASRYIAVPADGQFYRQGPGDERSYRIERSEAAAGDFVELPDGLWGSYLGGDQMRLSGGEYAEMLQQLDESTGTRLPSPPVSLAPGAVRPQFGWEISTTEL